MGVVLPPEIVDAIVDLFHSAEDRPSIQSCAMVCREWNSIARPHLFQEVVVHGEDDVYSLLELLDDAPGIGLVIQNLVVKGGTVYGGLLFLELVATTLPTRLPGLTSMTWSWLTLDYFSPEISSHLSNFSGVKHLRARWCTCSIPVLLGYITALSSLQTLEISKQDASSARRQIISSITPTTPLTSLKIDSGIVDAFVKLMLDSCWTKSLRSLTLSIPRWDSTRFWDFLAKIGPTLEQLDIRSEYDHFFTGKIFCPILHFTVVDLFHGAGTMSREWNLKANTNLRSLTIRIYSASDIQLPSLIESLSLKRLTSLHLHVNEFEECHTSWYRLAIANLSNADLPSLKEVKFVARGDEYEVMARLLRPVLEDFSVGGYSLAVENSMGSLKQYWSHGSLTEIEP